MNIYYEFAQANKDMYIKHVTQIHIRYLLNKLIIYKFLLQKKVKKDFLDIELEIKEVINFHNNRIIKSIGYIDLKDLY